MRAHTLEPRDHEEHQDQQPEVPLNRRERRAAARGGAVLSPRITRDLIDRYVVSDDGEARRLVSTLTTREREVLVQVGLGVSNAEIARQLFMGEGTVKTYVSRILGKLGRDNRVQAAIVAHEAGILPVG